MKPGDMVQLLGIHLEFYMTKRSTGMYPQWSDQEVLDRMKNVTEELKKIEKSSAADFRLSNYGSLMASQYHLGWEIQHRGL